MKRLVLAVLCMALLIGPLMAQDEAPQYLNIFTAHTKLGHQPQYEDAVKKLWAAMKQAGADFPVFASQSLSDPGAYNFVTLLSSMGDMDSQNAVFGKVFAQSPGVLVELSKHSNGNESAIIQLRPDLGYQPANPRLSDSEMQYARLTFLYAKPEHALELEGVIKEFVALNKKKGIRDGFGLSQNVTGEGPLYAVRVQARSEADYYAQAEKNNQAMGDEGLALLAKAGPMIKRIEYSSGISRPDLSYQP